jgi:hypothetical protein
MKFFLGLLLLVSEAQGVQFWEGIVSYDPPFNMYTNESPWLVTFHTPGTSAGSNGVAEVTFSLTPIHPSAPLTIHSLKKFFDSQSSLGGNYYTTDLIKVGGREAVLCIAKINTTPQGPSKWQSTVTFFWEQMPAGQHNVICTINMSAESRETLGLLTNSLKTVKVLKMEEVPKSKTNKPQMAAPTIVGRWKRPFETRTGATIVEFRKDGSFNYKTTSIAYKGEALLWTGTYSIVDSNHVYVELVQGSLTNGPVVKMPVTLSYSLSREGLQLQRLDFGEDMPTYTRMR